MSGFAESIGPYWPFVLLVLVGFLPSEIWRVAAAVLARWVNEGSEVFVLVRLIATALVAAVVAKLLVQPPPALSEVPLLGRAGAVVVAVAVYFLIRRSLLQGILAGVACIVAAAALNAP